MRIGIDIGGTKIEAIAIAGDGRVLLRQRIPSPTSSDRDTVHAAAQLVKQIEAQLDMTGTVGVGHPGAISYATGLIKNANSVHLNGCRLDVMLEEALGRRVRLANDANCFALSEAIDGAAAGAEVVFGVILGTGVGGGVVINRQVLIGANAIAGEWGHNPLPSPRDDERSGPLCYCGRHGCIETFLCGPALSRDFNGQTNRSGTAVEIAQWADEGDVGATAAMTRYEDRLARALATIINTLDPDVIVLGGGLSNIDRLYNEVPKCWADYIFSDHVQTRLVKAQHGDSSGVRGAAWLWLEDGED